MGYLVAFDETHNPLAKIGQNYQALQRELKRNDFQIVPLSIAPITRDFLKSQDIFVIPSPTGAKFTSEEITAINHWVREDGGGLFLLSHTGGDGEQETNLNELAQKFGLSFESDKVVDPKNNFGIGTSVKISNFIWHPITEDVKDFCYRLGCTINAAPPNIAVASSSPDAKPPDVPIMVAGQCDEGRVVATGSFEILQDQIAPNLEFDHNAPLASNIFKWLISDKRLQMHPSPRVPVPPHVNGSNQGLADVRAGGEVIPTIAQEPLLEPFKVRDVLNELVQLRAKPVTPGVFNVKLILVGDANVGKTSLAFKSVEQRFIKDYIPTLGTNIFRKTMVLGTNATINWMVWDLGGQEIMRTLRKSFFAGAEAIFLVFDVTNPSSLESIETRWFKELESAKINPQVVPTLILANKSDLVNQAKCTRRDIQDFCQKNRLDYVAVSALTGEHIAEALEILAHKFYERKIKEKKE